MPEVLARLDMAGRLVAAAAKAAADMTQEQRTQGTTVGIPGR